MTTQERCAQAWAEATTATTTQKIGTSYSVKELKWRLEASIGAFDTRQTNMLLGLLCDKIGQSQGMRIFYGIHNRIHRPHAEVRGKTRKEYFHA